MDPMTQLISGLPDGQQPGNLMPQMPQQSNMFANMQPQQPQAPQQPQYQQPQVPQWQQPVPQPPAPGQMPQYPPVGMPQVPGNMPMMPQIPYTPQLPSDQPQAQVPEWAREMYQSIQKLEGGNGGQQPPATFDPNQPWSSDNRPKSWEDMRKANETMATQKAQEIVTKTLQQQQQQTEQQRQQEQQINQQIDTAFNRLSLTGALPPVQNPNDPSDPGKQAQAELLGYTLAMGGKTAEDMLAAAPSLIQRHMSGQYFDPKTNQLVQRRGQSAAAYAPIAGGMPVMGNMGAPAGPTQSQLAMGGRDLGSLMQMGMDAIQ